MKWLKRLQELGRETEQKAAPQEETRKAALRIEELEARLAPNALWSD